MKYDCWLHWNMTAICNFNCEYCFYYNKHPKNCSFFSHDIEKIEKTLNSTGKIFRIGLTGNGEPFLQPDIYQLLKVLSKKHYFSFNTNLVSIDIEKITKAILPERIVEFHISCHPEQLLANNLLNKFIKNYKALQKIGYKLICKIIAYPPHLKINEQIILKLKENGIAVEFESFIGFYNNKTYPNAYTLTELNLYNLKKQTNNFKGMKCNAGYNVFIATPQGNIFPCFQENTKLGTLYSGFNFTKGTICRHSKCGCPLHLYDKKLFQKFNNLND